jgi:hypothetical protein
MNSFGAEIFTCLAVAMTASAAVGDAPAPDAPPAQVVPPAAEPTIESLIADLANERFAVREAASKTLWERGDVAIGQLKQAATGTDPEAAYRAREILRKLDLFITPGTDPAVIRLVERYKQAPMGEKADVLNELREKRAYRQILRLFAAETDPKLRSSLLPTVEGLAVLAARECLLANDAAGARALLEMAPADTNGLLALAAFHRANGSLDAELERAKTSTAKGAKEWQLALLRADGRIAEAQQAAEAAGDPGVAATMALMAGDPAPWLEFGNAEGEERMIDLYSPLALRRWKGEELAKDTYEPLVQTLKSRSSNSRQIAFNALFLLGQPAIAEPVLAKLSPIEAFSYFESAERLPEALAALGLDPQQPDFAAWVAPRFERLIADPDESNQHRAELVILASFLESRGLDQELSDAFDKQLANLAEKEPDGFASLVGDLCGQRFPNIHVGGPVLRVASQWAGDDDDRWEDILVAAFGDNDDVMPAWTWLGQLKPEASRSQRLQAMFALAGFGVDPERLRDQWLALAWDAINKAEPELRLVMLKQLEYLLAPLANENPLVKISIDVENKLKIHDLSRPAEGVGESDGRLLLYLSAANRWEEAAKVISGFFTNEKEPTAKTRPDLHAYIAACLRRAGKEEQAAEHDLWAEKLALGDAAASRRIALGYAFGNDFERCSRWFFRALCEAEPGSDDFDTILEDFADDLLNAGKWSQAAAASEVLAQRSKYSRQSEQQLLRIRLQADLARGLSLLEKDRPRALKMLENCHSALKCDSLLADHFFPALRAAGLIAEHDQWFEKTWEQMQAAINLYPKSHNTRNSAAWLASRAMRHLDEAEAHLNIALTTLPNQAAYLDTMAEIQFARGRREEALAWSKKSINSMPSDSAIRRQFHRFTHDPLPK